MIQNGGKGGPYIKLFSSALSGALNFVTLKYTLQWPSKTILC